MNAIAKYLPLFKLRICWLITLSAVVGLAAAPAGAAPATIAFLALATLTSAAAASALNHYFDRDIDTVMKRTSGRPLASNASPAIAPIAALILLALSAVVSIYKLNYMATLHLFLGAFVYAVLYTVWLKRRSWLNIIVGGLAGSFAVLAGGASAEPGLCLEPMMLAIVMFFWTPSHFWSFAIVHRDDYERAGVPMLPNVVGDERAAKYILVNTLFLVASSAIPVFMGYFGAVYAVAAFGAGAYFIYWNTMLVLNTTKALAWKNFKASMAYLGVLFAGVLIDVIMR